MRTIIIIEIFIFLEGSLFIDFDKILLHFYLDQLCTNYLFMTCIIIVEKYSIFTNEGYYHYYYYKTQKMGGFQHYAVGKVHITSTYDYTSHH